MKLAIMQPYFFPYVGYFQLIESVDHFVFYDDVNFIKKGWINRNNLLINKKRNLFSIPLKRASQNILIKDIELNITPNWIDKFFLTIESNYKKSPFFDDTYTLLKSVFESKNESICNLATNSIISTCDYLGINKKFSLSSQISPNTKGEEKSDRLINICKENNSTEYINTFGGEKIYNKDYFKQNSINLYFSESSIPIYSQHPYSKEFVPYLSIIDILMFNSKEEVKKMLNLNKIF